jgi:hypothetical protein
MTAYVLVIGGFALLAVVCYWAAPRIVEWLERFLNGPVD